MVESSMPELEPLRHGDARTKTRIGAWLRRLSLRHLFRGQRAGKRRNGNDIRRLQEHYLCEMVNSMGGAQISPHVGCMRKFQGGAMRFDKVSQA